MCCICNFVNCVRRRLSGCGCGCNNQSRYSNCECSRYREPRTNVICGNREAGCFEPCTNDRDTRCHDHHHDCGCDY